MDLEPNSPSVSTSVGTPGSGSGPQTSEHSETEADLSPPVSPAGQGYNGLNTHTGVFNMEAWTPSLPPHDDVLICHGLRRLLKRGMGSSKLDVLCKVKTIYDASSMVGGVANKVDVFMVLGNSHSGNYSFQVSEHDLPGLKPNWLYVFTVAFDKLALVETSDDEDDTLVDGIVVEVKSELAPAGFGMLAKWFKSSSEKLVHSNLLEAALDINDCGMDPCRCPGVKCQAPPSSQARKPNNLALCKLLRPPKESTSTPFLPKVHVMLEGLVDATDIYMYKELKKEISDIYSKYGKNTFVFFQMQGYHDGPTGVIVPRIGRVLAVVPQLIMKACYLGTVGGLSGRSVYNNNELLHLGSFLDSISQSVFPRHPLMPLCLLATSYYKL